MEGGIRTLWHAVGQHADPRGMCTVVRLMYAYLAGLQPMNNGLSGIQCVLASRYAQGQEAAAVPQLLDEVLSTALERALEPQLLEGMVLERIMSGKQSAT